MSGTDISVLYRELTDARRRGRLARARAAVKRHPDYSESGYLLAVETAFQNWEAVQNTGRQAPGNCHQRLLESASCKIAL